MMSLVRLYFFRVLILLRLNLEVEARSLPLSVVYASVIAQRYGLVTPYGDKDLDQYRLR